jgi:RimJ/RimL family protein N-acetyltransferase
MLSDSWPLFDLRVVTPRITLAVPTDEQLDVLAQVALEGIHNPEHMPFGRPWTRLKPPHFQQSFLQHHWLMRAQWSPNQWSLPMIVLRGEEIIGSQGIRADCFAAIREVGTGSWLGLRFQQQGLGREMREAILHLAFFGLGAQAANTSAHEDNMASLAITRSLGYTPNGETVEIPEGRPVRTLRYRMSRQSWKAIERTDIEIAGLTDCQSMFVKKD